MLSVCVCVSAIFDSIFFRFHSIVFSFFAGTNSGVHNESSCSSGPDSPHTSKELHLDGSGTPTRAQYLSASCVVFTHYSGDTATVVDEHFSRALNFSNKDSKGESTHTPILSPLNSNEQKN